MNFRKLTTPVLVNFSHIPLADDESCIFKVPRPDAVKKKKKASSLGGSFN
jgi:hypothetical protein